MQDFFVTFVYNPLLKEGLEISSKPLKDVIEVKRLGEAFDYLNTLSELDQTVRETDIRSLHKLLIGDESDLSPGEYRNVGVIISGAEHRPPEPLEIQPRMEQLVHWINENLEKDPIAMSAVAHHELVSIHPFKDGNGRVSRLVMNMILLKHGYPICNIRRENRADYYESLAFGDIGIYGPLISIVHSRCADLFSEYKRIRTETKRTAEWAVRWGDKATQVLQKRESREMALWQSRIRQVFLEFQNRAELMDEEVPQIDVSFYDYKTDIDFERYQRLLTEGFIDRANAFSITFKDDATHARFMFRYYRNYSKFLRSKVIPLELNYFDPNESKYIRLSELQGMDCIRLRELYFTSKGNFVVRYFNPDTQRETKKEAGTIAEAAQWLYDDVLRYIFHLT